MFKRLALLIWLLFITTPGWAFMDTDVTQSQVGENWHTLRTGQPTYLYKLIVTYSGDAAANKTLLLYDTDVTFPHPADGATTLCNSGVTNHARGCLVACYFNDLLTTQTQTTVVHDFSNAPMKFKFGVMALISTATACSTQTIDTHSSIFTAQVNPVQ